MATYKQLNFLKEILDVLDTEFDFGEIGQKGYYSVQEASELIRLNKDEYFTIVDCGQCTVRQYNILIAIAGRKPKFERHEIGFSTAVEWISKFDRKGA